MITPQIENNFSLMSDEIEKSNLAVEEKARFLEMLNSSKETCNGLSDTEKLQGLAENAFATNCVLIRLSMRLKEFGKKTWVDVALKALTSWNLVVIVGILATLLLFRPEISQVLVSFAQ